MEFQEGNSSNGNNNSMFWIIVKIAFVILIVFIGIRFFSEKNESESNLSQGGEEKSFVERKKTKPKTTKKYDKK